LQWKFKLFKLNPDIYYLSEVPIKIQLLDWALLNIGTLLVCVTALILPSVVITRISPVKAIRFN
jgi:lipoprotein-releasing system permease protein